MLRMIDVSNWQSQVNWDLAKDAIDGALVKASEGDDFTDPDFHLNWASLGSLDLPRGCYHFCRPFSVSGRQDASYFLSVVKGLLGHGDVIALDLEDEGSDDRADLHAYAIDAIQTIESAIGVPPIIYSRTDYLQRHNLLQSDVARCGLWLADWQTDHWPESPSPWTFWALWQYGSGPIPGIAGNVDLDLFNGSADQFRAYGVR